MVKLVAADMYTCRRAFDTACEAIQELALALDVQSRRVEMWSGVGLRRAVTVLDEKEILSEAEPIQENGDCPVP